LIRKIFSEKIGGILVGDRSEDERGHAVVKKGGVGQKFVDLRVYISDYQPLFSRTLVFRQLVPSVLQQFWKF
jgi:hypothetical protein